MKKTFILLIILGFFLNITEAQTHSSENKNLIVRGERTPVPCPGSDIYGQVTSSTYGPIQAGAVYLFQWVPYYYHWDTISVSSLDASGYYHFANIPNGDYAIEAFADPTIYTLPDMTPALMPSYYDSTATIGTTVFWECCTVVNITNCLITDTLNIVMRENVMFTGFGHIQGRLTQGYGYHLLDDPIPGIDVKLAHSPFGEDDVIKSTTTSPLVPTTANGGYYEFFNIPDGCYIVYVDIPGLKKDSVYPICIHSSVGDTTFFGLDYFPDSAWINPHTIGAGIPANISCAPSTVGITEINNQQSQIDIYPNPTSTIFTITSTDKIESVKLYDVLGRIIKNERPTLNSIEVDVSVVTKGIYFAEIITTQGIVRKKLVKE